MRILAISDVESKALWDYYNPDRVKGIDVIVSCGDVRAEYLEFLVTMTGLPVLYVPGNHDSQYVKRPPEGCINIDGKVFTLDGVRFVGFGGSRKYSNGKYMYTEDQMRTKICKVKPKIIKNGGVDILVTHAACMDFGDMEDYAHRGFACFNEFLERVKPPVMLHGHVHASYRHSNFKREMQHPTGTNVINCYEKYAFNFDLKDRNAISKKELSRNLRGAFWTVYPQNIND
ncbi:MAG: metallophosphoesterase family protein [Lachnospiraceae bacterium]|nr:metallophosphoesterase family protein [Lachnospiraceae bacterium]